MDKINFIQVNRNGRTEYIEPPGPNINGITQDNEISQYLDRDKDDIKDAKSEINKQGFKWDSKIIYLCLFGCLAIGIINLILSR